MVDTVQPRRPCPVSELIGVVATHEDVASIRIPTPGASQGPTLMSIIEQLLPLGRDGFFNSDCEKADGKTS
jgi:hypothetical protein